MRGGVILFRGTGAAACRYLESDRSRADEYYLEAGTALAEFSVVDGTGTVVGEHVLAPEAYRAWVDWVDPLTGEPRGRPRLAGNVRQGSPRFAEMVVNTPKSLSIAAALHPDVSEALDGAQRDAVAQIRSWLGQHSVTRVGPRGAQEVVPVERLETVAVSHKTSRAGDPHRHVHLQIGTRVWAGAAWRGLDTAALFRQQGTIRALGTAVVAAHPRLAAVLDRHGLSLDPVTGEVAELVAFNGVLSKRAEQVTRNLAVFEAQWQAAHPGQDPGPVVSARLQAQAWDHERPHKKPARLGSEAGWRRELDEAGYSADLPRVPVPTSVSLDDVSVLRVAARALDRCAADASTWTVHDIQRHVSEILTETGVRAHSSELAELITMTTRLAADDCLSVLPPGTALPEHVAHLTTVHVIAVETQLRDLLAVRAAEPSGGAPDVRRLASGCGLDDEQEAAAAAVASQDALVVVEGAAGAGKTTMLGAAIQIATAQGRATRVLTPTKKAADVAALELGVPTDSVAKLVHAHGWRWDTDGVWTRLRAGQVDPDTGTVYPGPPAAARLRVGERIVVDEAGMLDQDTALALLTLADEARTTVALVGDRAQLPAVGRGGVLDMAVQLSARTFDLTGVHRFADPQYADLTVQLRSGENPGLLFDQLRALDLITLHASPEDLHTTIGESARDGDAITTATNEEARTLNTRLRQVRVQRGQVDDTHTTTGADGLPIGAGDTIQTRHNDAALAVANRQTWTVQHLTDTGDLWVQEAGTRRAHRRSVRLPAGYVAAHTHLAYATTAYGAQGATTLQAHTVLSDGLDAAGLYVGMTRGQHRNTLHVVASDLDDARDQFVAALARDRADRGLDAATSAARDAVDGLVPDGPVAVVNAERARLREQIQTAEREATRLELALAARARQAAERAFEHDQQTRIVTASDAHVATVRALVAAPLIEQATTDGTSYLNAQQRMWQANRDLNSAHRFGRRAATRTARDAEDEYRTVEEAVRRGWGDIPYLTTSLPAWAKAVAEQQAETDPRLIEAQQAAEQAHQELRQLTRRHRDARAAHWDSTDVAQEPPNIVRAHVAEWRNHANEARRDLAEIEALPVVDAAELIGERTRQALGNAPSGEPSATTTPTRRADPEHWSPPSAPQQRHPARDFGPRL